MHCQRPFCIATDSWDVGNDLCIIVRGCFVVIEPELQARMEEAVDCLGCALCNCATFVVQTIAGLLYK